MMIYLFSRVCVVISLLLITSASHVFGKADSSAVYEETDDCMSCQPVCCGQGFISADLLYWRAFVGGLDSCVTSESSDTVMSDGKIISRFKGIDEDPHFGWNPGFRINAGYAFACSNWDIAESWTHFHSSAHGSVKNRNKVRWHIDFDVLDLVAGYEFNLGPCFALRPFGGFRGARIDQKLCINELPGETGFSMQTNLLITHTNNKEKFIGVGPLIGLGIDWCIGCGFDLFVDTSITWMYGNFNVQFMDVVVSADTADISKIRQHLNASLAGADVGFGIRWQKCFCDHLWLVLQLGFEHHRYFDYNRIGGYGDLSFDGINFSAGIGF